MFSRYDKSLLGLLIVIIIFAVIVQGEDFLSVATLNIFMYQIPELGLISLALMLVMIESGLNLSVMATTTLSGIIGALTASSFQSGSGMGFAVGILVMLVIAVAAGAVNGFIVSYLEVPTILGTLGTMLLFRGIALNVTQGGHIASFSGTSSLITGKILGMPATFILFCLVVILLDRLMRKHRFGRHLYKIGKDKGAAIYSGIDVRQHRMMTFMLSGLILGLAAITMTTRYNSISVDYGSSYLMSGVVVVSLGGVLINGGKGTVAGVVLALILVNVVMRIMNIANVDADIIDAVFGGLLILNILFQHMTKNSDVISLINSK